MSWQNFEQSLCRVSMILYRLEEAELARAEAELERLLELAGHYRRVARGESRVEESGSASHLCRTPSPRR